MPARALSRPVASSRHSFGIVSEGPLLGAGIVTMSAHQFESTPLVERLYGQNVPKRFALFRVVENDSRRSSLAGEDASEMINISPVSKFSLENGTYISSKRSLSEYPVNFKNDAFTSTTFAILSVTRWWGATCPSPVAREKRVNTSGDIARPGTT